MGAGAPPEPASVAAARKLHHLLRSRDLRPALSYLRTLASPFTLLPNHALNALLRALAAAGRVRAATSLFRAIPTLLQLPPRRAAPARPAPRGVGAARRFPALPRRLP